MMGVVAAAAEFVSRLRPVRPRDRELSRRLDADRIGSGSVRVDRDLARSVIACLDHGATVTTILTDLPMHDDLDTIRAGRTSAARRRCVPPRQAAKR